MFQYSLHEEMLGAKGWVGVDGEERVDWRNRKKELFDEKSITQSKLSHFEANTMLLLFCLHV